MTLEQMERRTFGAALDPLDRLVAGVCVVVGGVGHALLAGTFLALLYALVFVA
jgi:hypothetical protein